jgi:mannosylglycoprotein endo-beta-mannosidase
MKLFSVPVVLALCTLPLAAQDEAVAVGNWQLQDVARVSELGSQISSANYRPVNWYKATVPGTILTTLVDNKVYPEPLYGENMRQIPESLNKTSYWYRTTLHVPPSHAGRRTWLHFGGVNYSAEIWLNGRQIGSMRGAFVRGDFEITGLAKPQSDNTLAVLIAPQPHPGIPHEHTVLTGMGRNGGETAVDGPTFLSTIGWDWMMAVRDRDAGIWLPVTLSSTGPVAIENSNVVSTLSPAFDTADLNVATTLENRAGKPTSGTLVVSITGGSAPILFRKQITVAAGARLPVELNASTHPELHVPHPRLWWPNGYGDPNLYHLNVQFEADGKISDVQSVQFGIRKVEYEVPDSESLTISVNGVRILVRGGNWGLDEAMKRIPRERLETEVRMHAQANLNLIRNWVGQSTSPDFYDLADRYGIMVWDEFFQPNPGDGPNVTDIDTYLNNVTDKVLRFRSHPSIVIWCARNEGYPPPELDRQLSQMMKRLDPTRLYQSSSTDGRGVSSHGPYYWRAPQFFYQINEAFKTETGSVSVPTIESIQGMMPQKDWETINDDWAQHDMAAGAQRGNEYPFTLAKRYGPIRNLADFVRKAQLANYEAFRAMYESRNATMFQNTTGVITWMSHPAQPSFVWQLYHYDLEPNAALFATQKACEPVHVQFNQAVRTVQIVNNHPVASRNLQLTQTVYSLDGHVNRRVVTQIPDVPASTTITPYILWIDPHISEIYFLKLDLTDEGGRLLSSNFYWNNVALDEYTALEALPTVQLNVTAVPHQGPERTTLDVTVTNPSKSIALMTHLQLHRKSDGQRVLPVFYSDNYLSLAPGESRNLTVEAATQTIAGGPVLMVDGYNVDVVPVSGDVSVLPNDNAQPLHWPKSELVPADGRPVSEPRAFAPGVAPLEPDGDAAGSASKALGKHNSATERDRPHSQ